jgi:CO/xanthine dehydrogenase FAD-binding subunit
MQIWQPGSINDVFAIARNGPGELRLVAGSTALQLDWAKGLPKPEGMIDLSRLGELKGLEFAGASIRLGALTTLADLLADDRIAMHLPLLASALKVVAGPSVRNLATLGGNVAGRAGCLLPALIALDAEIEIRDPAGRTILPLADWLAHPPRPLDIVAAIRLTQQPQSDRSIFRKTGLRRAFTPSIIKIGRAHV